VCRPFRRANRNAISAVTAAGAVQHRVEGRPRHAHAARRLGNRQLKRVLEDLAHQCAGMHGGPLERSAYRVFLALCLLVAMRRACVFHSSMVLLETDPAGPDHHAIRRDAPGAVDVDRVASRPAAQRVEVKSPVAEARRASPRLSIAARRH